MFAVAIEEEVVAAAVVWVLLLLLMVVVVVVVVAVVVVVVVVAGGGSDSTTVSWKPRSRACGARLALRSRRSQLASMNLEETRTSRLLHNASRLSLR